MYYIIDYDTDKIVDALYERPSKEWLNRRAKELMGEGKTECSLYTIVGEKDSRLTGGYDALMTCPIHHFAYPCPSCRLVAIDAGVEDFSDTCEHGFASSCPLGCN